MYPKIDNELVEHMVDLMIAYNKAQAPAFLVIGAELEDLEEKHPPEFARAEQFYYLYHALKKEREAYKQRQAAVPRKHKKPLPSQDQF